MISWPVAWSNGTSTTGAYSLVSLVTPNWLACFMKLVKSAPGSTVTTTSGVVARIWGMNVVKSAVGNGLDRKSVV